MSDIDGAFRVASDTACGMRDCAAGAFHGVIRHGQSECRPGTVFDTPWGPVVADRNPLAVATFESLEPAEVEGRTGDVVRMLAEKLREYRGRTLVSAPLPPPAEGYPVRHARLELAGLPVRLLLSDTLPYDPLSGRPSVVPPCRYAVSLDACFGLVPGVEVYARAD